MVLFSPAAVARPGDANPQGRRARPRMALRAEAGSGRRYRLRIPGIQPLVSLCVGTRARRNRCLPATHDPAGRARPPALAPVTKDSGDSRPGRFPTVMANREVVT